MFKNRYGFFIVLQTFVSQNVIWENRYIVCSFFFKNRNDDDDDETRIPESLQVPVKITLTSLRRNFIKFNIHAVKSIYD